MKRLKKKANSKKESVYLLKGCKDDLTNYSLKAAYQSVR